MLTIDHGESAPSRILGTLHTKPLSARPQKSIQFSCSAAIPPPAALCGSMERIYSLFFNGLELYNIKSFRCQFFFDSGKMYQSYIIPSHLTKLMKKLQHADDAEFKKFMQEEYGKYEWFRDQSMSIDEPSSWKNHRLRQL
jgi:hypothetical protein